MYLRLLQFLLIMFCLAGCTSQAFNVMTYNIRLDVASDGVNRWDNRKDLLTDQIINLNADIVGTQEGRPNQIEYLDKHLKGFSRIGEGRDGGDKGEYTAIYYREDRFEVTLDSTFWLSETPRMFSKGWDSAYPRICTYGLFLDKKTKSKFWVANTHLDNKGVEARQKGINLVLDEIETIYYEKLPVILMGDFNVEQDDELIQNLNSKMIDAHNAANIRSHAGTFNAFDTSVQHQRRIDYIYISKGGGHKVLSYDQPILINDGRYPSDHFPVIISLRLI